MSRWLVAAVAVVVLLLAFVGWGEWYRGQHPERFPAPASSPASNPEWDADHGIGPDEDGGLGDRFGG